MLIYVSIMLDLKLLDLKKKSIVKNYRLHTLNNFNAVNDSRRFLIPRKVMLFIAVA